MNIRRTVPNISSASPKDSVGFYKDFLGFNVAMDMDWIITFASENNSTAQISVIKPEVTDAPHPDISIEVEDVDKMYAKAKENNIAIVYPLTDEPWGVRRFFVKDPSSKMINILSHL